MRRCRRLNKVREEENNGEQKSEENFVSAVLLTSKKKGHWSSDPIICNNSVWPLKSYFTQPEVTNTSSSFFVPPKFLSCFSVVANLWWGCWLTARFLFQIFAILPRPSASTRQTAVVGGGGVSRGRIFKSVKIYYRVVGICTCGGPFHWLRVLGAFLYDTVIRGRIFGLQQVPVSARLIMDKPCWIECRPVRVR